MAHSLIVTYELFPPSDTPAQSLGTSKTHEIPVDDQGSGSLKGYYNGLRKSIAQAKDVVGEELTVWRDAVGNRELKKEPKKLKKDEEDEEEGEEEE